MHPSPQTTPQKTGTDEAEEMERAAEAVMARVDALREELTANLADFQAHAPQLLCARTNSYARALRVFVLWYICTICTIAQIWNICPYYCTYVRRAHGFPGICPAHARSKTLAQRRVCARLQPTCQTRTHRRGRMGGCFKCVCSHPGFLEHQQLLRLYSSAQKLTLTQPQTYCLQAQLARDACALSARLRPGGGGPAPAPAAAAATGPSPANRAGRDPDVSPHPQPSPDVSIL